MQEYPTCWSSLPGCQILMFELLGQLPGCQYLTSIININYFSHYYTSNGVLLKGLRPVSQIFWLFTVEKSQLMKNNSSVLFKCPTKLWHLTSFDTTVSQQAQFQDPKVKELNGIQSPLITITIHFFVIHAVTCENICYLKAFIPPELHHIVFVMIYGLFIWLLCFTEDQMRFYTVVTSLHVPFSWSR